MEVCQAELDSCVGRLTKYLPAFRLQIHAKALVTSVTVPLTMALTDDWADVLGHRKSAAIAADASNLRTIVHLLWQDASFSTKSAHKQERIANPDWKRRAVSLNAEYWPYVEVLFPRRGPKAGVVLVRKSKMNNAWIVGVAAVEDRSPTQTVHTFHSRHILKIDPHLSLEGAGTIFRCNDPEWEGAVDIEIG
jgi:hypothetical protein